MGPVRCIIEIIEIITYFPSSVYESPRGLVAKVLDCDIEESKIELQSCQFNFGLIP